MKTNEPWLKASALKIGRPLGIRHFDPSKDLQAATEMAHQALLAKDLNSVTAAVLAPVAGLSVVAAEEALLSLTLTHPANVSVDDSGELVFEFLDLRRVMSSDPTWLAWWKERRQRLIFLAALFLGSPIAALASYSAINMAVVADQSSGAMVWVLLAFFFFSIIPSMAVAVASIVLMVSAYGFAFSFGVFGFGVYALFAYESLTARFGGAFMMMTTAVMVFAIWITEMRKIWRGQSRKEIDQIAEFCEEFLLGHRPSWENDQKRIVKLLKDSGGVISATQLMLEFGMNRAEAHSELTRVLLDFGGDIETTDEGAILYHFHAFKGKARKRLRYTPFDPPPFFTKYKWIQVAIWISAFTGLVGFILNPEVRAFPGIGTLLASKTMDEALLQGFGVWPALIIGIFLIGRLVVWVKRRQEYRVKLPTIRLIERLRKSQSFNAPAQDLDSRLLAEFGGTVDEEAESPAGEVSFVFPMITVELEAGQSNR